MGRKSSGWTVVKKVAKEIDRANRANHKTKIAQQKASTREEDRIRKLVYKEYSSASKKANQLQDKLTNSLNLANSTTNLNTKQTKLSDGKNKLRELENLNEYVKINNLNEINDYIELIQKDIDSLWAQNRNYINLESESISLTLTAIERRNRIANVLLDTLTVNDAIIWDNLKDKKIFSDQKPLKPNKPILPLKPIVESREREPNPFDEIYNSKLPFFSNLYKSKRISASEEAKNRYLLDLQLWKDRNEEIKLSNEKALNNWEEEIKQILHNCESHYIKESELWENKKHNFITSQLQFNQNLVSLEKAYKNNEAAAIEEYCKLVLSRSEYPFTFFRNYQLEYIENTKTLVVNYALPTIEVVPDLKEAKYIKSKREIKNTYLTTKQIEGIYNNLLYSIVIRTLHELFEADTIECIRNIVLNGWITCLDKATGREITNCILTISVNKAEFMEINLANVDAKECFKKFKGIGSTTLSSLVPIAPILDLNKEDKRFVNSEAVANKIQEGDNLAAMHWEDFEHLIREIFEKEFAANGSEVKITQASRDGGIDAVMFDPDPIRGGKIVLQAKRYTNTVGVSAVRDLYGTVINEGAMKGILITTSEYGPDAYNFAKDKPLTLMTGANLLYLLSKHGTKARIDLVEAKKLLK